MPFKRKISRLEADQVARAIREDNLACIYVRVSTEKQGEDGKISIPKQIEDCQSLARQLGLRVAIVYTEKDKYRRNGRLVDPSGEYEDRPQFKRMIADGLAGKFQHVIAWHEWRIYRGVKPCVPFAEMLEKTRITVHLVNGAFDVNMVYIKASIGKMELDAIRQRIAVGNHGKMERGLANGIIPFGYRRLRNQTGQVVGYEIVEGVKPWFEELARLFMQHVPMRQIARELPPLAGFTRPDPHPSYYAQRLGLALFNPIYRGLVHQNGKTRPGLMPPMWDAATIAAIDAEWARRDAEKSPRGTEITLSGWMHCAYCGSPLIRVGYSPQYKNTPGSRQYGCSLFNRVRDGRVTIDFSHPSNTITERTLLSRLQELFASVTEDEARALVNQLQSVTLPDHNTRHADILRGELDQLQAEVDEFSQTLKGKLPEAIASYARDELTKRLVRIGEIEARLETADQARPVFNPETVVAAMLQLATDPAVWDLPMKELRPRLERALPMIYVANQEVALDREALPAAPLRMEDLRADALRVAREYVGERRCSTQAALAVLGEAVKSGARDTLAARWYFRRTALQEEHFRAAWNLNRDF